MKRSVGLLLLLLVACGSETLSLQSAMSSYGLYMEDLVKTLKKEDLPATARAAVAFQKFMMDKPHSDWLGGMEPDARTRYHRQVAALADLIQVARRGNPLEAKESFKSLRVECLDCHFINMQGTRREAIEGGVPGLN